MASISIATLPVCQKGVVLGGSWDPMRLLPCSESMCWPLASSLLWCCYVLDGAEPMALHPRVPGDCCCKEPHKARKAGGCRPCVNPLPEAVVCKEERV